METWAAFSSLRTPPPCEFSGIFGSLWGRARRTTPLIPHSPAPLPQRGAPRDIGVPQMTSEPPNLHPLPPGLFSSPPKKAQNESNCPGQQRIALIKPFPRVHPPPKRGSAGTRKRGSPQQASSSSPAPVSQAAGLGALGRDWDEQSLGKRNGTHVHTKQWDAMTE